MNNICRKLIHICRVTNASHSHPPFVQASL
ncbi:hypothetical protein BT93_L3153 [Corymbia citriodora subsp. variegata]|uniref:Uncharacterized protein n=1 Tax=Corymbia citriodora subsp. variegata TaxID=360336 RepID=A0A8T0CHP8_CORYI|nr:hypothetical protein BT93_L3153 [Corymbia citriodora subsp. variegata]